MTAIGDELQNCRGPHCNYKAPVCKYGYCAVCCRKHHDYLVTGLTDHKVPELEPIVYGFRIVHHPVISESKPLVITPAVETPEEPPKCGGMEPTTTIDFPVESEGSWCRI